MASTQAAVATSTAATISRTRDSVHVASLQVPSKQDSVLREPDRSRSKKKLTELGEDGIALVTQGADDYRDVGVGTTDENIGGDGGGESHSTTGENRKDSGEAHYENEGGGLGRLEVESESRELERSGMPGEAGDYDQKPASLYTPSTPPRGLVMYILVAGVLWRFFHGRWKNPKSRPAQDRGGNRRFTYEPTPCSSGELDVSKRAPYGRGTSARGVPTLSMSNKLNRQKYGKRVTNFDWWRWHPMPH